MSPGDAAVGRTRTVLVDREARERLVRLAREGRITEQQVLRAGCSSLLSRVRWEFETLCVLWYPDDVDTASFEAWSQGLRRTAGLGPAQTPVVIPADVGDHVCWIAQYVRWPAAVVLAEATA